MDADMPPEAVKPLEAPGRAGDLQGEPAHQPAGDGKRGTIRHAAVDKGH